MKRITVGEVCEAARVTQLSLVQGETGNGKKTACPLAALYVHCEQPGHCTNFCDRVFAWADRTYTPIYTCGFMEAVDGTKTDRSFFRDNDYTTGYRDGLAVREHLWPSTPGATR